MSTTLSESIKDPASFVCSCPDQSGVLHEVHQPGPQPEEDAVQEAERSVWSQNQRGDKVRAQSRPPPSSDDVTHSCCGEINATSGHICRRERSKVPYIVRQCIEEVEKRGIDEVGIYRISGVATDIQNLKSVFDTSKNPRVPCRQKTPDVHQISWHDYGNCVSRSLLLAS